MNGSANSTVPYPNNGSGGLNDYLDENHDIDFSLSPEAWHLIIVVVLLTLFFFCMIATLFINKHKNYYHHVITMFNIYFSSFLINTYESIEKKTALCGCYFR